ncbi:flagellar motor protein MotB [Paenibacillus endoradicis]|uniref:flagellar motor protein MotB n=1 Tax=Paenibacillus endoradicis TaxID=2972487 RepID=UPI002158E995|nr:flagellar motor protein MotB [Paenibacillus endoradicis]MCR8660432.1 OmpA family protein [Paenibacillus endoradicis]
MSKKRRHEDHEEHIDESWLIPYADLMTLLLALFIVLYSMNAVDTKKFEDLSNAFSLALSSGQGIMDMPSVIEKGPDADQENGGSKDDNDSIAEKEEQLTEKEVQELLDKSQVELSKLKEELDTYIAGNGLSTSLETSLNMSQLVITIRDNALFDSAEATVNSDGKKLAISIANMLDDYPDFNIIVAGHTDNTPIRNSEFSSNWDLSVMRAVRFMDIMLTNKNLDPKRFNAGGYGEYHPVVENDTAENKAKNRRVEISIVHNYIDENKLQSLSVTQ